MYKLVFVLPDYDTISVFLTSGGNGRRTSTEVNIEKRREGKYKKKKKVARTEQKGLIKKTG